MNHSSKSQAFLAWLEDRTGIRSAYGACSHNHVRGNRWLGSFWPSLIVFTILVEFITGLVLWMYYSPSAQTAWESVYYIQYQVAAGALLRGIHHYGAQVLVALLGLYVILLILSGLYRRRREFVLWIAVFMGLTTVALCLTGDLLAWSQYSLAATQTRVSFLMLLPGIGNALYKLAVGGPTFGHLTLTRFFALHVGVFSGALFGLTLLHGYLKHRASAAADRDQPAVTYWPQQFLINSGGCLAVMVIILLLVYQHALSGDDAAGVAGKAVGVPMGAPADPDPANAYAAARPEWSMRALYEMTHMFPGNLQIMPIFVIPHLALLYILAMPLIGRWKPGHALNVIVLLGIVGGMGYLTLQSYRADAGDPDYQAALAEGRRLAARTVELAQSQGIPPGGALTLLAYDPQTQGPKIFQQHCAACHPYTDPNGLQVAPEDPSAMDLFGFASAGWIRGLLDPEQVAGPKYFGNNENFAEGDMASFVQGDLPGYIEDLGQDKFELLIAGLAAEGQKDDPSEPDEAVVAVIEEFGCADCHKFYDSGALGHGPDLTGYGSRDWLIGIISDPEGERFYPNSNDNMPAYHGQPEQPEQNLLSRKQVEMMAEFIGQGTADGE
jgi:ubiquinol-cytochrome c reductase cytochrome b subunit